MRLFELKGKAALIRLPWSRQEQLEYPIGDGLLSPEHLCQHAEELAQSHSVTRQPTRGRPLLPRLMQNAQVILQTYKIINAAVRERQIITPAAEWIIDNYYVTDEQIRGIRVDLPKSYYRQLPKLVGGQQAGYPRVYALALEYIAHSDSRFDPEVLGQFIAAYQRHQHLSTGELWAIPIALRLALVENLRRLALWVVEWQKARQDVADLAQHFLSEAAVPDPEAVIRQIESEALPSAFVVHLLQRLRETPVASPIFAHLLDYLAKRGTSPDELVSLEHARQAAANVSVSNIINSMRAISAYDWELFFNQVSLVEKALDENPIYAASDFATRDRLRHSVEELAKGSRHSEVEVARRVAVKARAILDHRAQSEHSLDLFNLPRQADPGFYLMDQGRAALEQELGFRAPPMRWLRRAFLAFAAPGYLGTIGLATAAILMLGLWLDVRQGAALPELILLGLLALIPASDLAIALVNRYVLAVVPPRPLPKLDLKAGIPPALSTVVVVPTLLTSQAQIEEQVSRLEAHYFANPDGELRFALLSDWVDAPSQTLPEDQPLLQAALEGIQHLNTEHGTMPDGSARFLLFQRQRLWNPKEGCWMGWERKRGKLEEFNRLLRGAGDTSFVDFVSKLPNTERRMPDAKSSADTPMQANGIAAPPGVQFVITLDADTELPRGTAARLVGALAHPLNRPVLDPHSRRVVEGYGILQPRITPSLPEPSQDTVYRRIFSGPAGIDPYASASSDIYQDVFGEGNFTGKGIYDVDAFSQSLEGRVPENSLLSHDLFEGLLARTALVSDIELVEDFPISYEASVARQHRWVRGDWQLLPWLFSRRAPIPPIGRWKMLDNLRRSLSAPTAFLTLLVAWSLPLASSWPWTALVLVSLIVPPLIPALSGLVPRRPGISRRVYVGRIAQGFGLAATEVGLALTLLAHQAWLILDAIGRTLLRLIRQKRMLEWRTAAQTATQTDTGPSGFYRRMYGGPVLALVAGFGVVMGQTGGWMMALPFLLIWLLSPLVARWISLPQPAALPKPLGETDSLTLRQIARRTWHFFEVFVGPEDHHLPPDNFQEDPKPLVAHRTSPTNIGLYLLSIISARDFGWIGLDETLERLEASLNTLGRLEKFRGQLYNWYDTRDLRVLEPRYVSSVDSGNLAGHLIALQQALPELAQVSPDRFSALEGLRDGLSLVVQAAEAVAERSRGTVTKKQLLQTLSELAAQLEQPAAWGAILDEAEALAASALDISQTLLAEGALSEGAELLEWSQALLGNLRSHQRDLRLLPAEQTLRIAALSKQLAPLVDAMGFDFLYDPSRKLFSIGYDVRGHRLDPNCYDLLASESRLTSFVAIARGEVPTGHWFRLGRTLTPAERSAALVSWSGSMFEYLMPALVMHSPNGSLLEQTYRTVVARQISYGRERGVPWGVSESAMNSRDREMTYQYSAFGLPGLGLKRGLADELVIAPYATALAAMVDPLAAVRNFALLASLGASSRYGFYDALDYTARRLPEGQAFALVRNHMAHHQGMLLVALGNVLLGSPMQRRFYRDVRIRATATLLHERAGVDAPVARPPSVEVSAAVHVREMVPVVSRRFTQARQRQPQTHLLSNGRYQVMLSAAGSGYSRWKGLAVTRWREDATCDDWGSYIYLRDVRSGLLWSATAQPTLLEPTLYEAQFYEERARFFRREGDIASTLQVLVSPEDDAEIRRVALRNYSEFPKELELASYAEVVLAPPSADAAHPAFSKLFVKTEFIPELGALLATRRPRSADEAPLWAAQVICVEGTPVGALQFETDRSRFLGRGPGVHAPAALMDSRPFAGTSGNVLDPIFSLRVRVRLEPGEVARVGFTTLIAPSRAEALVLADKYRNPAAFERIQTLAWTDSRVELRYLGIESGEAALFQELTGHLIFPSRALRGSLEAMTRNHLGQPVLWRHGISGDLPIVLVRIAELGERELVRQIMRAFQYWRRKRLAVDLVILDEEPASYASALQAELRDLQRVSQPPAETDGILGDVFMLQVGLLSSDELEQLQSVARVVLSSAKGTLAEQLSALRPARTPPATSRLPKTLSRSRDEHLPMPKLEFFNGLGGFSPDGREYVIGLSEGQWTPAPWVNVVANEGFGFLVSESGGGYNWASNSRENKLTPWSNDPVTDPVGEAWYLRDEDSGELWSPTARPIRSESGVYLTHHGQGYSRFEHSHQGIYSDLTQFVPLHDPLKISRLRLENRSGKPRRITLSSYTQWVLGVSKEVSAAHTVTEMDPSQALLAWNPWSPEFANRVAFADLRGKQQRWTCDRTEFVGRGGTLQRPQGVEPGARLSGKAGAALDPCAVLQTALELAPGESAEVVLLLGQGESRAAAQQLIQQYRSANIEQKLDEVRAFWDSTLGMVQVHTPDRALDLMLNRWLLYQNLSSRIWARSGFYQAGGAYGFRDQLQDGMALTLAQPEQTRRHLLRAAAHQFPEGDVQHWWHPPSGRGVRTHISDDLLWLPYTTTHYLEASGDAAVLDETVPFLEGQPIPEGQEDGYFEPRISEQSATLYEHCARALERSLALGPHGLPLIGGGDWNDGLNRVGQHGKGESVWLAWFLHTNLWEWAKIAESRGEKARAKSWRSHVRKLKHALESEAWDGDWYLRAFFDDGTPLGSSLNSECRIDAIAQSWAVLSGAGAPDRASKAMKAVEQHLLQRENSLMLLFTPPFEHTPQDPGYIKGYPAGVRENGGQYTHAAVWSAMAFAALGDGDTAGELLSILNPVNQATTRAGVHRYKVEPYVMAADIYAVAPHIGRGGWTWYTGSAGWMYRAGLEWLLGFRVRKQRLYLDPCIPKTWREYSIRFQYHSAVYEVQVENPKGVCKGVALLELDSTSLNPSEGIGLVDDGRVRRVRVVLG
ncbi:MAG: glucoamylase family protein [Meiothermus sp.]|nr:glucoamylase family protein [Meiothermus sp.]